jgi:hypothetical protein
MNNFNLKFNIDAGVPNKRKSKTIEKLLLVYSVVTSLSWEPQKAECLITTLL